MVRRRKDPKKKKQTQEETVAPVEPETPEESPADVVTDQPEADDVAMVDGDIESDSDMEFGEVLSPDEQKVRMLDELIAQMPSQLKFKTIKQFDRAIRDNNLKMPHVNKVKVRQMIKTYSMHGGMVCFMPQTGSFTPYLPPKARNELKERQKEAKKQTKSTTPTVGLVLVVVVALFLLVTLGVSMHQYFPHLFNFNLSAQTGYKDYYEIMGVERNAKMDEIKSAYRKHARELHPDRNPNCKNCGAKLALISEAYKCLSDESRRSYYDINGRDPGPPREKPGVKGFGRRS